MLLIKHHITKLAIIRNLNYTANLLMHAKYQLCTQCATYWVISHKPSSVGLQS